MDVTTVLALDVAATRRLALLDRVGLRRRLHTPATSLAGLDEGVRHLLGDHDGHVEAVVVVHGLRMRALGQLFERGCDLEVTVGSGERNERGLQHVKFPPVKYFGQNGPPIVEKPL